MKTKILQACYTVYIPDTMLYHPPVVSALEKIDSGVGGSTAQEVVGLWGDTAEEVTVITWWHSANLDIHEQINTLVWAMLEAGEEAVAVEFQDHHTPRRMELRTKD